MKKLIYIVCIGINVSLYSQILIKSQSGSVSANPSSSSVLLEFSNDANKGLILPWTNGDASNPVNGTIIFNTVAKKIKVYADNAWVDYTNEASTNNAIDTSLQTGTENINAKVVIGSDTSVADGILVLESTDKAIVLPKVASPHLNIINPAPGMIVFDTVKELICVYNGTQWSFIQKNANP